MCSTAPSGETATATCNSVASALYHIVTGGYPRLPRGFRPLQSFGKLRGGNYDPPFVVNGYRGGGRLRLWHVNSSNEYKTQTKELGFHPSQRLRQGCY